MLRVLFVTKPSSALTIFNIIFAVVVFPEPRAEHAFGKRPHDLVELVEVKPRAAVGERDVLAGQGRGLVAVGEVHVRAVALAVLGVALHPLAVPVVRPLLERLADLARALVHERDEAPPVQLVHRVARLRPRARPVTGSRSTERQ